MKTMTRLADVKVPTEELPLWMRQARQNVDWGILLVSAFSILVAWSFLLQSGLPTTNASENYVFMTTNYANDIRDGHFYPRWNTHANLGYGAPIPNYIPPGAPYSAALVEVLFTADDSVTAVQVIYVLSIVLSGTMMYVFVLRQAGAQTAIITAVAYVYSPYAGLVAPHINGDLPIVMAMALVPTVLWSVDRLARHNAPFDFLLVALSTAALLLTEPRYTELTLIITALFLVYHRLVYRNRIRIVIFAIINGACLAAFFWLPALLERDLVRWVAPFVEAQPHILTWDTLLTPLRRIDLNALVTPPQYTLGLPLILLVIGGIAGIIYARRFSIQLLFLMIGVVVTLVGVNMAPDETWLMGIIVFCLAIGGSGIIYLKPLFGESLQRIYTPIILVLLLVLAFPVWLSPYHSTSITDTSAFAQLEYERNRFGIAALPPNHDFPTTLHDDFVLNRPLYNSYRDSEPLRLDPDLIGIGREYSLIETSSHRDRYQICFSQPLNIDIWRAYFPGWRLTLADAPAQRTTDCPDLTSQGVETPRLYADSETGLMLADVPGEGDTQIATIALQSTDVRWNAWLISWLSLGILALITLIRIRRHYPENYPEYDLLDITEARLMVVITGTLTASILLFASPFSPFSLHARLGHSLDNSIAVPPHRTNEGIQLISYRLNETTFDNGDTLILELAWRTTATRLLENFQVQLHIRDRSQNIRWQQTALTHPGGYPTRRWLSGFFVTDLHRLEIAPSLIPGEYELVIEVYGCTTFCPPDRRVTFFGANRESLGQTLALPTTLVIE